MNRTLTDAEIDIALDEMRALREKDAAAKEQISELNASPFDSGFEDLNALRRDHVARLTDIQHDCDDRIKLLAEWIASGKPEGK